MSSDLPPLARHLVAAAAPTARRLLVASAGAQQAAVAPLVAALTGVPERTVVSWDESGASDGPFREQAGLFDCILVHGLLERLPEPETWLRRLRGLLATDGALLCSASNAQSYPVLLQLLRGDLAYGSPGLPARGERRLFTYAAVQKLLLDAGFAPRFVHVERPGAPAQWLEAAKPLLEASRVTPFQFARYVGASGFVLAGRPLGWPEETGPAEPVSFVVCVNDPPQLQTNLLASPDLALGSPHEVLAVGNCRTAAEGFEQGLRRARHPLVIYVHQDLYLPRGWVRRFREQYRLAQEQHGPPGVAGVWGFARIPGGFARVGTAIDKDRLLCPKILPLPARCETLDEIVLAFPRDTPLRFDPQLGFHAYAGDVCLTAETMGLPVVALDALCLHNQLSVAVPPAFTESAALLGRKWAHKRPFALCCALIDREGKVHIH
jgi:hypothetical protein